MKKKATPSYRRNNNTLSKSKTARTLGYFGALDKKFC